MENIKSNLTLAQTVLIAQRYKMALQFCKAWCSKCVKKWTTCGFDWKSWIADSLSCLATPQKDTNCKGMNNRYWSKLAQVSSGGCSTRHGSNAQGISLGTWRHVTSPQLEQHRCPSAWPVGCFDSILTLVTFSYILSCLSYISLRGYSNMGESVSPWGDSTPDA
jgi:hypothetical protein